MKVPIKAIPESELVRLVLVDRIANRFVSIAAKHDAWFDLRRVRVVVGLCDRFACPLDLRGLSEADDLNIVHDVGEILKHFNLQTFRLPEWFQPRFAKSA